MVRDGVIVPGSKRFFLLLRQLCVMIKDVVASLQLDLRPRLLDDVFHLHLLVSVRIGAFMLPRVAITHGVVVHDLEQLPRFVLLHVRGSVFRKLHVVIALSLGLVGS